MTKAFWMATEILQARTPDELQRHHGVTVIPSEPGTFRITANVVVDSMLATSRDGGGDDDDDDHNGDDNTNTNTNVLFPKTRVVQLWERKADGGFPPINLIKFEEQVKACLDDNSEGSIQHVKIEVFCIGIESSGDDSPMINHDGRTIEAKTLQKYGTIPSETNQTKSMDSLC